MSAAAVNWHDVTCTCVCGCGETWTVFERRRGTLYADGEACRARVNRDPQLRAAVSAAARANGQNGVTPHPTPQAAPSAATTRAGRGHEPARRAHLENGTRVYLLPDELALLRVGRGSRQARRRVRDKLRAARRRLP